MNIMIIKIYPGKKNTHELYVAKPTTSSTLQFIPHFLIVSFFLCFCFCSFFGICFFFKKHTIITRSHCVSRQMFCSMLTGLMPQCDSKCARSLSLYFILSPFSLSLSQSHRIIFFNRKKKDARRGKQANKKKLFRFRGKNNNNNNIVVDFLVVFNVAFVHSFFASSTSPWRSEAPKVESMAVVLFFFFCLFPYIFKRNSYIS